MRELPDITTRARVPWLRVAALIGVITTLVAIAPALWTAIAAGAGLLVLGGLLLSGWACLQALPYLGQRLEKQLLRARLADARDNPLEELLSQLVQRTQQLERYRAALANIAAQIEAMHEMLEDRRAAAPQHDIQKQAAALHKMQAFHAHHVKNLAAAEVALTDYKRHLTAKRFEWNFAQAGKRVLDGLRATDRESILRELLSDEATRSVQLSFNRVFATLDAQLQCVEQQAPLPVLTGERP